MVDYVGIELSWYPGKILKKLLGSTHSVIIESVEGLDPADVYREVSKLERALEKAGYIPVRASDIGPDVRVHVLLSSGGVVYIVENTSEHPIRYEDHVVGPRGVLAFACALTP